jgi:TRAP-type C4-dicarboxylate transport system substrate-binding protein
MKVRGPTRQITKMLGSVGATPVGMPLPQIPDALSKGTVEACAIPWEVVPSVKVHELTKFHSEFPASGPALYTTTFVMAMNKARYESLAPDLKKVIDNNSGLETAALFGRAMDEGDKPGRDMAVKAGNNIVALDVAETQRWRRTASTVETDWVNEMKGKGIDGARLASEARSLIAKYAK